MAEHKKEEHKEGEHKRKHLHQIRSVQAEDGSIVHHHTYKAKAEDHHTEPERENVATSQSPEEAGEHVSEQMGMNAPAPDAGAAPGEENPGQPAPDAAPAGV